MATQAQIFSVRLDISDPPDFIKITIVASTAALPAAPTPQTCYYVNNIGVYVSTDKTSGAVAADYKPVDLYLSDARIGSLIDLYGVSKTVYKALSLIAAKIGSQLRVVRNTAGADSTEYIKLLDLYNYYKAIISDFKDESDEKTSGRWGRTTQPEIGGGNL